MAKKRTRGGKKTNTNGTAAPAQQTKQTENKTQKAGKTKENPLLQTPPAQENNNIPPVVPKTEEIVPQKSAPLKQTQDNSQQKCDKVETGGCPNKAPKKAPAASNIPKPTSCNNVHDKFTPPKSMPLCASAFYSPPAPMTQAPAPMLTPLTPGGTLPPGFAPFMGGKCPLSIGQVGLVFFSF